MQQVTNNNSRVNSDSALKSRSNNISSQVENKETVKITALSVEQAKKQYNQSILESNLTVSLSMGNESMALLYKTAIDEVNIALEGELGENAIQEAYDSGLDITPEATAERIISMSTAFFSGYRDQNPEMSESEAVNKFSEIIAGGIETGFSQARGVLDGLKVLEGEIADNIDVTYGLVQQGLQAFVESFLEAEKAESSEEESA
jgi:hypothetical protein